MLTTPLTTTISYGSQTDDVFINETLSQSPSDGFVGFTPPPPPPPVPPIFNNNIINNCKIFLPHQEVNLIINRENLTDIQARSVPTMLMSNNNNIWTRRVLPNLRIKQSIFDQHYGESKSIITDRYRRASVSTSSMGGGGGLGGINDDGLLSFVLLDATSKMLYDVPMRHLLQLVKKDYDDDTSIDHVIRAIDETHMKSEWLDAVTALNKQFDKRPEDKARVLAHKGSTHGLVVIEQFFVKLIRVPAYEFKLIYLKFCEEAPTQLERMHKHINDLIESIEVILTNEQLPGILHLLCLLYNSITDKTIPGLHFDSLLSVLTTRTPKQNITIAHILCHLLEEEEQYLTLLNIFDNQILLKLKDLSLIKYIPIYNDIRLLYTRYKQLNLTLKDFDQQLIILPEHIKTTLNDFEILFIKLFDDENKVKQGEKDLSIYFCLWDLSLDICLLNLGQFIDKLRLAYMQNIEQRRRNELLIKQQRTIQTPTRSFRNTNNQYCSDTNIFRDHLNVPLTPITARQRNKVNKVSRDRYSISSRDVSYTNDEQQEQITQNLLPNAIPRKRGHSPTAKTVLTKRPFNVLGLCTTNKQQEQSDDVFLSITSNMEHKDTKMDCTTDEIDHLLPSNESLIISPTSVKSICENQSTFYLTTPVQNLYDSSNDQTIPINNTIVPIKYENDEFEHINDNEKENNINHYSSSSLQNSTEVSSLSNIDDNSNYKILSIPKTSLLSSDSETLDEDFESQSNFSEIVESTSKEINNEFTHSLTFNSIIRNNNEQLSNLLKISTTTDNNSTSMPVSRQKTSIFKKRIPSMESLRSIITNNNSIINNRSNQNIQRCAVSRQISIEKDVEDKLKVYAMSSSQSQISTTSRRISSTKSKNTIRHLHSVINTSSFTRPTERPLRAFQMSSIIKNESQLSSSKNIRKSPSNSYHHDLTSNKTFANKTILSTILPSSNLIINQNRLTNTMDDIKL